MKTLVTLTALAFLAGCSSVEKKYEHDWSASREAPPLPCGDLWAYPLSISSKRLEGHYVIERITADWWL